jgi:polar amino acid transport system substrate-binding protein
MIGFKTGTESRRFRIGLVLLVVLVSACTPAVQALQFIGHWNTIPVQPPANAGIADQESAISAWIGEGDVLYAAGRYAEALDAYDRALALSLCSEPAWRGRGNCLVMLGDYEGALRAYSRACAPGRIDSLAQTGRALPPGTGESGLAVFPFDSSVIRFFQQKPVFSTVHGTDAAATPAPSPDADLVTFVNDAYVYYQRVGKAAALREFSDRNGSFTRGDRYIWAYDFNGTNLAHPYHPEYTGQDKSDLTDAAGFRMIDAMRDAARNGSGFVSYQYENPVTGKTEPKLAYVKRVDDSWWLASGIYGPDLSVPQQSPDAVRQSLEEKVNAAVDFARKNGRETALTAFNNASGPFAACGTYVFAFDMDGTTLAMPFEPGRIGRNERNLTDPNGVLIGERKIRLAQEGGGFFYYVFTNPASEKPEFKVSCVKPVDSGWAVGAGMYLPGIPAVFPQDQREKLVSRVNEAVAYVGKNGKETALRTFNDPNGTFSQPDMYIFAFDRNGTYLANPYLPGIVGLNRLSSRDPYGEYHVPYIIANAEQGGGFMYYFLADPAMDYKIRLKLTYSEMAGGDLVVGAGIYS